MVVLLWCYGGTLRLRFVYGKLQSSGAMTMNLGLLVVILGEMKGEGEGEKNRRRKGGMNATGRRRNWGSEKAAAQGREKGFYARKKISSYRKYR
ncbi:hypothetical protein EV1_014005 [Malus domestica]